MRIASYRNTEVVLEADSPDGGWVVLNDLWHPWWFAEVDGKPAEILRANVLFRAVAVPPGRHVVRFTFRPIAGRLGRDQRPRRASQACHAPLVHAGFSARHGMSSGAGSDCDLSDRLSNPASTVTRHDR